MVNHDLISSAQFHVALSTDVHLTGASLDGPAIDTQGFRYAIFVINLGTLAIAVTTLNVVTDAAVAMASPVAVAGAVFAAADIGILATDDDTVQVGMIDTHSTERFLRLEGVNGAGSNDMGGICILTNNADTSAYAATANRFSV